MNKVTIIKCNMDEIIKIQKYLFKKGYSWYKNNISVKYFMDKEVIYMFVSEIYKNITWNETGELNRYSDYDIIVRTTAKNFFRNLKLEKINE